MAIEPIGDRPGDDADLAARTVGADLERRYRAIAEGPMRDVPLCNPALSVAAVGFSAVGGLAVGIVATPWFMNLVVSALPGGAELPPARVGDTVVHGLPGGEFDCVVGTLDGFGRIDSVSLFSPMFDFADTETMRATAEAAIAEIVTAPVEVAVYAPARPARPARPAPAIDRRALLFGRRAAGASEPGGERDGSWR